MATATNSRIFGAIYGITIHAAQTNYTSAGITGRLYVANQQAISAYPTLADTQWINGIDESRFTWYIAYLVTDNEGIPQLNTKIGTQTSAPPQITPDPLGESTNAYIRFKGGDTNDAFIAAIQDIKTQNEAVGNVLNNGSFPTAGAAADEWKNWADANLDYYTNFVYSAVTTSTTAAPEYFYATVANCDDTWSGLARSTQRLVDGEVYNVDTSAVYPAEAGEKVVVISNSASAGAHNLEVTDFNTTSCGGTP